MQMIKKIMLKLTGRQIIWGISGMVSLVLALIIVAVGRVKVTALEDQNVASRWSNTGEASQISCFFSREAGISEDSLIGFGHQLSSALQEASITNPSENANARLWADAYSAGGKVFVESNRTGVELNAVGIGGDFFLFHPLKLKSGAYFSGNALMKDYIVLDEDAAWQLFGSNDIVGQIVYISKIPHLVAGVVERQEGRLEEAAGLNASIAYVSYETLSKYGTNYGINTYEIVMPNPVSGYAKAYVMENIGVQENEVEIVENTSRFEGITLFKGLAGFGTRSMSSKAIIYPYWENIARGYEDILMLCTVFVTFLLFYPLLLLVIALRRAWKHKTWTAGSVWHKLKDKLERLREKQWARQKAKKEIKVLQGQNETEQKPQNFEEEKDEKVE